MANKDSVDETIAETKNDEEVINVSETEEKNKKDTQDIVEITDDDEEDDDEDEIVVISKLKRFFAWFWKRKKITLPIVIVLLAGIIFGFPTSRYTVLGTVIKKDFPVIVTDISTGLPVSEATVSLRGKTATTDGEGKAVLQNVPVGYSDMTVSKNYYDQTVQRVAVGLSLPKGNFDIRVKANGRQVPVHAVNKITGKALAGVTIKAGDSTAQTDENGDTVIVLSPDVQKIKAEFTAENYNLLSAEVTVSQQVIDENTFELVPSGRVYFLSKRTGKLNVMSSNLDGSDQKILVKGTGKEDDQDNQMMATTDWKYLALRSQRSGKQPRLYLIKTETGEISEVDGADDVYANMVGWSGHTLVYQITREKVDYWKANNTALKSFNADTEQLAIIDQNRSRGSREYNADYERIEGVHLVGDKVLFMKSVSYNSNKKTILFKPAAYEANLDGTDKTILKEFEINEKTWISSDYYRIDSKQKSPLVVEIRTSYDDYDKNDNYREITSSYTYKDGQLNEAELDEDDFYKNHPTYLLSPGAKNTLWYEARDGKNTLIVGGADGQNGNTIADQSEYKPYGWYTDNYVLVSKSDNELYIMPSNGTGSTGQVVKIANYQRTDYNYWNTGGGYGGI